VDIKQRSVSILRDLQTLFKLPELKSQKPETSKRDDSDKDDIAKFPESTQDIMHIFGGPDSQESKRKQKH
jgi:hypothetical protein